VRYKIPVPYVLRSQSSRPPAKPRSKRSRKRLAETPLPPDSLSGWAARALRDDVDQILSEIRGPHVDPTLREVRLALIRYPRTRRNLERMTETPQCVSWAERELAEDLHDARRKITHSRLLPDDRERLEHELVQVHAKVAAVVREVRAAQSFGRRVEPDGSAVPARAQH
jgi:hypothetical protein